MGTPTRTLSASLWSRCVDAASLSNVWEADVRLSSLGFVCAFTALLRTCLKCGSARARVLLRAMKAASAVVSSVYRL